MADTNIVLGGEPVFEPSKDHPVYGGGTRMVPMVPVGDQGEALPCIWKSKYTVQAELSDGSHVPAHECLLLVSRKPILTMRAEVAVDAWQHFSTGLVEW